MLKSRAPLFAGIAIVAILAGFMAAQFIHQQMPQLPTLANGTLLPEARTLPDFELVDSTGQRYTRAQLQGKWSLLFFGYTSCPDVCPTTLAMLAQVDKSLIDLPAAQRPQIVFLSIDPKRDTPTQVASYIKFFSPNFVGVTGEPLHIDALTHAMGVPVEIHQLEDGSYTVDHSATLFLIDPQARMAALFSPPHTVTTLSADLRSTIRYLSQ